MTNEATKVETACEHYLSWIADTYQSIERLKAEREQMRGAMDMLSAVRYDAVRGGSMQNGDDAIANYIERLERIDENIVDKSASYVDALEEWQRVSLSMPPNESLALELHYIRDMPWERVAEKVMCSERSIYRIRLDALYDLYELLPEGWQ